MAEAKITVDLELKGDKLNENAKKAAETFASRMEKGVGDFARKLGLGKFAPVAAKAGEAAGASSSAIAQGVAAGMAAGGILAVLNLIADAVSGLPVVTAIMKILKAILILIFLPLQGVILPALQGLVALVKILKPITSPKTEAEKGLANVGAIVGAVLGGAVGGVGGALIGGAAGALAGGMLVKAWQGVENLATIAAAWMDKFLSIFGIDMDKVRVAVVTFLYETIPNFFTVTIPALFSKAVKALGDLGERVWRVIKAFFTGTIDVLAVVWEFIKGFFIGTLDVLAIVWEFIKGLFIGTIDVILQVWEFIKGIFKGEINVVSVVWEFIKSLFKGTVDVASIIGSWLKGILGIGGGGEGGGKQEDPADVQRREYLAKNPPKIKKDFIITPSGMIETDPADYIIGTKNPRGMGGAGMTVNINIDKPTLAGQADIKMLVKAIELELYKANRRFNSYI